MIIGITGKARSGKDTFAETLAEEFYDITGRRFVLVAYAHELKLRVQKDFDLSYAQLWGDEKEIPDKRYKKSNVNNAIAGRRDQSEIESEYWTPREILQAYGQFFRTIDDLFWVKNLFKTIEDKKYINVIITDVRHPNEADPVKERSGYIIRVNSERSNKEKIHGSQHISEIAMDTYKEDITVVNDLGLKELSNAAKDTVNFILEIEKNINKN
jgi:hypothetical protein